MLKTKSIKESRGILNAIQESASAKMACMLVLVSNYKE